MELTVLLENTSMDETFACAHGLSLLLETNGRRILFDMGPGAQFSRNAEALGIDLASVEFAVLSHGHYDHGGGLDVFLRRNQTAPVYLAPDAFAHHSAADGRDIGLDPHLDGCKRLNTTAPVYPIGPGMTLFSAVKGDAFCSPINATLYENGAPDHFAHEQSLLLEADGTLYLFGGCAHCGIVNIMNRAIELAGRAPDVAVSGFHLSVGSTAPDDFVRALGRRLLDFPTQFYTCHCTGAQPYALLREVMGARISALSGGMRLTI